jgi:hypothetical protein
VLNTNPHTLIELLSPFRDHILQRSKQHARETSMLYGVTWLVDDVHFIFSNTVVCQLQLVNSVTFYWPWFHSWVSMRWKYPVWCKHPAWALEVNDLPSKFFLTNLFSRLHALPWCININQSFKVFHLFPHYWSLLWVGM